MAITGLQIRQERRRRGLTQQQLANAAGVGLRTIGRVERGELNDPRSLDPIAGVLGLLPRADDTDEETLLRSVSDSALLAEVARRFSRNLASTAARRGRGDHGTLPAHLAEQLSHDRRASDG